MQRSDSFTIDVNMHCMAFKSSKYPSFHDSTKLNKEPGHLTWKWLLKEESRRLLCGSLWIVGSFLEMVKFVALAGSLPSLVKSIGYFFFVLQLEGSPMVPADKLTYGLSESNPLLKRMIFQ